MECEGDRPVRWGDRIDVSVTQSFDFPTSYVYRGRIANLRNEQVDLAYQQERQALMLEVGEVVLQYFVSECSD